MYSIYSFSFYCKFCKNNINAKLFYDSFLYKIDEDTKKEAINFCEHNHWCHCHRVCAICGEVVNGKNLDLILEKDYKGEINKKYNDWKKYPDRGLLTVHAGCAKQLDQKIKIIEEGK
jgi:hypothetical protein